MAPTVFFLLWVWLRNRYLVTHNGDSPPIERGVWFWLVLSGGILSLIVFAITALVSPAGSPDDLYVPPQEVDGKIVPGHFESRPK
jgi:hypothetical protein